MLRTFSLVAAALVATAAAPLSNAELAPSDATVAFWADFVPTGGQALADRCQLTLPAGADGVAVLDAAVAAGCIDGYTLTPFGNDVFLECVDGAGPKPEICTVCPPPFLACAYWALYYDGFYASEGLRGFHAGEERELGLSFEAFPASLVPAP